IVHAVTLLLILLFVGKWAAYIPMATLAGILIVVAWNMSELKHFVFILRGSKSDAAVLLITFFLTVLADLTIAIEVGMITAVFLFMRKVLKTSSVTQMTSISDTEEPDDQLPEGVEVFEINGPMFFGAAYKFKDAMSVIKTPPKVLVVRMRNVPIIDATGIHAMKDIIHDAQQNGTTIILSELYSDQVLKELTKARLAFKIGKANIVRSFDDAIERSKKVLQG
ncbi:MAG: STAS domain-containing protein, partial [Taibaiella sp.]|nr:STAS domain-containing protein [Taibaiella sp.]